MKLAAAGDGKNAGPVRLLDAKGDVALQLAHESFPQLATGDVFALAAGEGAIVDAKGHAHRRLFDRDRGQRPGVLRIGQRIPDAYGRDAGNGDDVARPHGPLVYALQVLKGI